MHDAWLVFNIKEGTIEYQYIIDLAVMKDCIPLTKEMLSTNPPMK